MDQKYNPQKRKNTLKLKMDVEQKAFSKEKLSL